MQTLPLVIVGAGPAGYTAAIYAAREGLEPVLVRGLEPGGQLMLTTEIENFPGFARPIAGADLMQAMAEQALACGARFVDDLATTCSLAGPTKLVHLDGGEVLRAKAVILATGARARWLDVPGESALRGRGVSACATCDAPFFRGLHVAVIGGGNTALTEALHLARFARRVSLIHRRDRFRAEQALISRVMADDRISLVTNRRVVAMRGEGQPPTLRALDLVDTRGSDAASETLEVDGAFVAIGHEPASALVGDQLPLNDDGTVQVTPGTARTGEPGVFVAGDLMDRAGYRQAVTAAASGCMAALDAARFLHDTKG